MAATLSSLLPAPLHFEEEEHQPVQQQRGSASASRQEKELVSKASASLSLVKQQQQGAPKYGSRKGWMPTKQDDYADGGA